MEEMERKHYPLGTIVCLPEGEHMVRVPDHNEWVVVANSQHIGLHFFSPLHKYQENAHLTTKELVAMGMDRRQLQGVYQLANHRFLVKGMVYSQNIAHKSKLESMEG